jgi:hypothetical protein
MPRQRQLCMWVMTNACACAFSAAAAAVKHTSEDLWHTWIMLVTVAKPAWHVRCFTLYALSATAAHAPHH